MRQRGVPGATVGNRTNGRRSVGAQRDIAWVGIDVGKTHHWACMVGADGRKLSSIKVANDEAEIVALIATANSQAKQIVWSVDIIGAPSALLLALLARTDQSVRYASGRVVAAMSAAYAGEGKTDAIGFLAAFSIEVLVQPRGAAAVAVDVATWTVWGIFVVDYVVRLALASGRRWWFLRHLL